MLKRTVTGALITAAVYAIIYFSYVPNAIMCAAAILCAFAIYEIFRATDSMGNETLFALSVASAFIFIFSSFNGAEKLGVFVFVFAAVLFSFMMAYRNRINLKTSPSALLLTVVITLLIKSMPTLAGIDKGAFYLGASATTCFVTDIGAFLVGKFFGRHKLSPHISPNKTIEGAAGGISLAVVLLCAFAFGLEKYGVIDVNYPVLVVYSFLASLVCGFGDLAMSTVKRICGIKDFGTPLPGHGGLLDRFDSHIFTCTYTLAFCALTGGFLK